MWPLGPHIFHVHPPFNDVWLQRETYIYHRYWCISRLLTKTVNFSSFAANFSNICSRPQPNVIVDCSNTLCDCPTPPYQCPPDSIIVETRTNFCCVSYECVCPNISCPLLMECGQGVQPIPDYRGNGFPGRCCPDYSFEGAYLLKLKQLAGDFRS